VQFIEDFSQPPLTCWDGEIPRYDASQNPINPEAGSKSPTIWPVVQVKMTDAGLNRNLTFVDSYDDYGTILTQVWGTTRGQVMGALNLLEGLLCPSSNWPQIQLPGSYVGNPFKVLAILYKNWTCVLMDDVRLAKSQYCYRGEITWEIRVHGATNTQ
jgi:hypothetical protein